MGDGQPLEHGRRRGERVAVGGERAADEEEGGRGERGHGYAGVVVQRRDGGIGGGVDPGEREEGEGGDDAAGVDRLEATREAATRTRPSDGDDGRAGEAGLLVEGERRDVVDGPAERPGSGSDVEAPNVVERRAGGGDTAVEKKRTGVGEKETVLP